MLSATKALVVYTADGLIDHDHEYIEETTYESQAEANAVVYGKYKDFKERELSDLEFVRNAGGYLFVRCSDENEANLSYEAKPYIPDLEYNEVIDSFEQDEDEEGDKVGEDEGFESTIHAVNPYPAINHNGKKRKLE